MRNISITCFLFFVGILVPTICMANDFVLCKSIQAVQQGDSLFLNMQIEYTERLAKNKSMDIVPALVCGNQTYMLPRVILNGNQRQKVYMRKFALGADLSGEQNESTYMVLPVSEQGATLVSYRVAVPFYGWMERAAMRVYTSECECGDGTLDPAVTEYAMDIVLEKDLIFKEIDPEVSYIAPSLRSANEQDTIYQIFFDYDLSVTALDESAKSNQITLNRLNARLAQLIEQKTEINQILIKGYASPDGVFAVNKMIALKRAQNLAESLQKTFALPVSVFNIQSVDEDWEGLERELNAEDVPYKHEALSIIQNVNVFDGREKKLMELGNGALYHYMAAYYFPKLRRVEVKIDYREHQKDEDELRRQLGMDPQSLQLHEMNRLLVCLKPGSVQYKRLLAEIRMNYPYDETAILNELACAIADGDWDRAEELSAKKRTKMRCPSYENNMGVLCLKNGDCAKAEEYFRRAALDGLDTALINLNKLLKYKRVSIDEVSDKH